MTAQDIRSCSSLKPFLHFIHLQYLLVKQEVVEVLEVLELMAKKQPPGTVPHTIFLPEELHGRVKAMAPYGTADDLIVECVKEAIEGRWREWVKKQAKQIGYDLVVDSPHESFKKEVRSDSRVNAQGRPRETIRGKAKPAT